MSECVGVWAYVWGSGRKGVGGRVREDRGGARAERSRQVFNDQGMSGQARAEEAASVYGSLEHEEQSVRGMIDRI